MTSNALETVKHFYETVFQTGDIDAVSLTMANDFVDHAPWPGHAATREGFQSGTAEMRAAFPDLRVEPTRMIAEDDKVAVVVRISGTQHGEFMGNAPTGRAFEIEGVDILRVKEGKLLEHWGVMDVGRMLAQLRLAPPEPN
jgi:steroid delta-isomerase-like uncharacterized protein